MSDTVYERLQAFLDSLPVGYSKTKSGVEVEILKKIFEPEEAEMAMRLKPFPEPVEDFALRNGMDSKSAEAILERMAKKGQIFRLRAEGKVSYSAAVFLPGIWEYQLTRLDEDLAKMVEKYYAEALGRDITAGHIPIFRVVPVDQAVSPLKMEVMPYDRVKELVASQKTIAITNCVCRKNSRLAGKTCKHIEDTCLYFSHMARYYVENGLARWASVDEAIDALDRSEKDGLVHSPQNGQRPMFLCNCCGCCCVGLRGITRLKLPTSKVTRSDFYCASNPEVCSGCGLCLERCQVQAIELADEVARVKQDQCIGCGLCVTSCPTEALRLVHKQPEELVPLATSFGQIMISLAEEKRRIIP